MIRTALSTLCFCLLMASSFGQGGPSPVIGEAFGHINRGQTDKAIAKLDSFLLENPGDYTALSVLGLAYRSQKDYVASLSAYEKAHEAQPENGRALFNVGISQALAGNMDAAFECLFKVRDANSFNVNNAGLSPAATALKTDPRYRELFPTKEQFAAPFAEANAEIIHEWQGEAASDQFGWVARRIGDVDDDGVWDFVTSAPTNREGGTNAGKIYVYSGQSGALLWSAIGSEVNGQLGMSAESAGDVNNDGIPDVVSGAPFANQVYVYSGRDGSLIHQWQGSDSAGVFGRDVKGVGDLNGDGHCDVLIGEPFRIYGSALRSGGEDKAGRVWLYSGKDGEVLMQWEGKRAGDAFGTAISGSTIEGKTFLMMGAPAAGENRGGEVQVYTGLKKKPFFTMEADSTGRNLGAMFMSVVGDVDADGTPDLYAADFSNAAKGSATGRVYIYSGKTGKTILTLTGEQAGDGFGIGVADAGDVNQDGHADLVIGAWQYSTLAPSGGKVYVYSGKDGSELSTFSGQVVGETLGFDATGLGDVNKDGIIDLLITSAWSGIQGSQSGRVFVVSGKVE